MSDEETRVWRPATAAVAAIFEDEAVLYHGSSNAVIRINATAAAVWQRCDGRTPLHVVIDGLATSFGIERNEVADGVRGLVADLAQRGLLEETTPEDGA